MPVLPRFTHEVKPARMADVMSRLARAGALDKPSGASSESTKYQELRLGVLMKDAEFIRAEALLCIGRVRYVALFCIGIAGAALPAIATVLATGSDRNVPVLEVIGNRALILQIISVGVSLCAVALLQIYIGVFKQIFSFAEYFRTFLVPEINSVLKRLSKDEAYAPVLQWEMWLQKQRAPSRALYTADVDLHAEPFLISAIAFAYMAIFVGVSWHSRQLFDLSIVAILLLTLFLLLKVAAFRGVLKHSTEVPAIAD